MRSGRMRAKASEGAARVPASKPKVRLREMPDATFSVASFARWTGVLSVLVSEACTQDSVSVQAPEGASDPCQTLEKSGLRF
ncbi:hypothetical protein GmRootV15_55170 [Variovorax sp. V15]